MALLGRVADGRCWECGFHLCIHQPVDVRSNKIVYSVVELISLFLDDHLVCETVVLFEREVGRIVVMDFSDCGAERRPCIWC